MYYGNINPQERYFDRKSETGKNILAIADIGDSLNELLNDGNKRACVIFANHYLISHDGGMIIIPESCVPEFKRLLIAYYEGKDTARITEFMKKDCIKTFSPCSSPLGEEFLLSENKKRSTSAGKQLLSYDIKYQSFLKKLITSL